MNLALDKDSVRTTDVDGRLRVSRAPITMEQVAEYLGSELEGVEGTEQLRLDPLGVYKVYRSGAEIEKGAATSNSIQLLVRHIPVTANTPQTESVAGTTGSDAEFISPYLFNSLSIWTAEGIDLVESEKQKELSAGYRYRIVPEPGVFQGQRFDFRMVDLVFNHVALVERGRAGPTVVVGDSFPTERKHMSKKALPSRMSVLARGALLSVMPKLATDHKLDFAKLVQGVTAKNWAERKVGILSAIKPKLAQDADVDDIVKVIEALSGQSTEPDVVAGDDVEADQPALDDDPGAKACAMLATKGLSEDEIASVKSAFAPKAAMDEEDEEAKKKAEAEAKAKKEKELKDKPAMDADAVAAMVTRSVNAAVAANGTALRAELTKQARETRDAEAVARPYVGEIALAQDSADGVFKAALDILKVDVTGVHPSAYKAILLAQPKPGSEQPTRRASIALDSAPDDDFAKRFPNASRLM